jgi:hypothetical protein
MVHVRLSQVIFQISSQFVQSLLSLRCIHMQTSLSSLRSLVVQQALSHHSLRKKRTGTLPQALLSRSSGSLRNKEGYATEHSGLITWDLWEQEKGEFQLESWRSFTLEGGGEKRISTGSKEWKSHFLGQGTGMSTDTELGKHWTQMRMASLVGTQRRQNTPEQRPTGRRFRRLWTWAWIFADFGILGLLSLTFLICQRRIMIISNSQD